MLRAGSRGSILAAMFCAAALWVACVGVDPSVANGGGATDARSATEGGACTTLDSTDQFLDCPLANGGKETCPKATKACCPGTGCVDRVGGACPNGESKYTCISGPNCASESKACCIVGVFDPTPACGSSSVILPGPRAAAQCTDPALCNDGMLQLCMTGSDCGTGQCVQTAIVASGISFLVSACK
jgi:hypothetical protein